MKNKKLKSYTLEEVKDKFIGKRGTKKRENYEKNLSLDLLGEMIRETRKKRGLTQEQLGKIVGVQKAQISKLEHSATDMRVETLLKVFSALDASINFSVKLEREHKKVA